MAAPTAAPSPARTYLTNKQIAGILNEIAEMLEIKGESLFRIKAYRNAARSLEFLAEDAGELYGRGGRAALDAIPGVGASIAQKIEELLQTGRLRYYERIKKTIPAVTLELMKIPNIGPKTAQKLSQALRIKSIADLEEAIDMPRAAKVFKAKTRQRIKTGIAPLKRRSGRILLPFAEPIAREFVEALRQCPGVSQAHAVGSLRRMRETFGDIDIVCAAADPKRAIEQFVTHRGVEQVLARGDSKATIIHAYGVQLDLEILLRREYGSLLAHFTGSQGTQHRPADLGRGERVFNLRARHQGGPHAAHVRAGARFLPLSRDGLDPVGAEGEPRRDRGCPPAPAPDPDRRRRHPGDLQGDAQLDAGLAARALGHQPADLPGRPLRALMVNGGSSTLGLAVDFCVFLLAVTVFVGLAAKLYPRMAT